MKRQTRVSVVAVAIFPVVISLLLGFLYGTAVRSSFVVPMCVSSAYADLYNPRALSSVDDLPKPARLGARW